MWSDPLFLKVYKPLHKYGITASDSFFFAIQIDKCCGFYGHVVELLTRKCFYSQSNKMSSSCGHLLSVFQPNSIKSRCVGTSCRVAQVAVIYVMEYIILG